MDSNWSYQSSYKLIKGNEIRELKQTRRRRQREHHVKMQLSQLFKVIMLAKCVLSVLELTCNQRFRDKKTKLNICHDMPRSSTQLQNRSFHVRKERERRTKNARAKGAKLLFL